MPNPIKVYASAGLYIFFSDLFQEQYKHFGIKRAWISGRCHGDTSINVKTKQKTFCRGVAFYCGLMGKIKIPNSLNYTRGMPLTCMFCTFR